MILSELAGADTIHGEHNTHQPYSDSVIAHLSVKDMVARLAFNLPGVSGNPHDRTLSSSIPSTIQDSKLSSSVVTMSKIATLGSVDTGAT